MRELVGGTKNEKLQPAFGKALNILNKMPVQKEFVREHEAASFSESISNEIATHREEREDSVTPPA